MKKNLRVTFISSEYTPYAKSGGLADVVTALSKKLSTFGHHVSVIIPYYGFLKKSLEGTADLTLEQENVTIGSFSEPLHVKTIPHDKGDVAVYFIANEELFGRHSRLYGYENDNLRFAFFDLAALTFMRRSLPPQDIIHSHDWQTGLVPNFLKTRFHHDLVFAHTATVFTIHNMAFQMGRNWWDVPEKQRDDGKNSPHEQGSGLHNMNFLKRGIRFSDIINTVSERYAHEILTHEFGQGLDGLLRKRRKDVFGIINGIDYAVWNPLYDKNLSSNYDANTLEKKVKNKIALQKMVGLARKPDTPLLGVVNRLTEQKGFTLIQETMHTISKLPVQIVIVGSGEKEYVKYFRAIARKHCDTIGFLNPYREDMASLVYAGSDMFLMPSRFEPCGISQLISLRYGSIPIVHETGGLSDTISNWNPRTKTGNGFVFHSFTREEFLVALARALETYRYPHIWKDLVRRAMGQSFSWELPAKKYLKLYSVALRKRTANNRAQ